MSAINNIVSTDIDTHILAVIDPMCLMRLSETCKKFASQTNYVRSRMFETKLDPKLICAKGYVDVLSHVICHSDIDVCRAFDTGCLYGHIGLCNYLLNIAEQVGQLTDLLKNNGELLRRACATGQLDVVKYLIELDEPYHYIDIHAHNERAFYNACIHLHFDIADYLQTLQSYGQIDMHVQSDYIFSTACTHSKSIVIYLLELADHLHSPFDLHRGRELAFVSACEFGQLEIMQLLIERAEAEGNPIDIHIDSDNAFRHACLSYQFSSIKYLIKLGMESYGPIPDDLINRYVG